MHAPQNWGMNTPGQGYGGQRYIENVGGAPPLVHTQSMPALTMGDGMDLGREREKERGKTPRKKGGIFLR